LAMRLLGDGVGGIEVVVVELVVGDGSAKDTPRDGDDVVEVLMKVRWEFDREAYDPAPAPSEARRMHDRVSLVVARMLVFHKARSLTSSHLGQG